MVNVFGDISLSLLLVVVVAVEGGVRFLVYFFIALGHVNIHTHTR